MNEDSAIVSLVAIAVFAVGFWWFFGGHPEKIFDENKPLTTVRIKDGAYQPATIQVRAGEIAKVLFIREDTSICTGTLYFPELNMAYSLPLGKPVEVTLPPLQKGEISFNCQINFFRGHIVVV